MLINKNENKSYENLLLHRVSVCVGAFMVFRGWQTGWVMTDEDTKKIYFMLFCAFYAKEFFLWKIFFCHRFFSYLNDMNEMERK